MRPKTITIYQAAKLLTNTVSDIQVPSLTEMGATLFDDDDARYLFQTTHFLNHIVDAVKAGEIRALDEFTLLPTAYWIGMPHTQLIRMDDLLAYAKSLGYSLEIDETTVQSPSRPVPEPEQEQEQEKSEGTPANEVPPAAPRLREQERAVLAKLVELGYDPKSLPKNSQGKPGVPAKCKQALSESPLFDGATTFKKAWERLSGFGEVMYMD